MAGTDPEPSDAPAEPEVEAIVSAWPRPFCAACGTDRALAFHEMEPGADRLRWSLCNRCWRNS
jgi:hypothetical protein